MPTAIFRIPVQRLGTLVLCLLTAAATAGALRLAGPFSDGMVLQRDREIPVWGWADPGQAVTVAFRETTAMATADADGRWQATLGPFAAGGPFDLTVTGGTTVTVKDVLVGEVWICSGQSNMQWTLTSIEATDDIAAANDPNLRFVTIRGTAATPQADAACTWAACTPDTAANFSAVGYYFGRALRRDLKVPVGLINNAEGASPVRAWIPPDIQETSPLFAQAREEYATFAERQKAYTVKRKAWEADKSLPFPGHFEAYVNSPGILYNARIHPLAPLAMRGVVWYQGENDAIYKHTDTYRAHFELMIQRWRKLWGTDFPFLYVQIAALGGKQGGPGESPWAEVRDAQRQALELPATGMALTTDICESALHPLNKAPLGERLALMARVIAYGQDAVCTGPLFAGADFQDDKVTIRFTGIGAGLTTSDDKPLAGFAVAGADNRFVWADATIEGDTVVLRTDKVAAPCVVRYAWANNPIGNLANKDGFGASCFQAVKPAE